MRFPILGLAGLFYFFATASTFTSLGVVLYTMVGDLGWSRTDAGAAFSVLGFFCGITSLLPALMIKRFGTRLTLAAGGFVMAAGFALAARVTTLEMFLVGTALMGSGFTLVANVPAMNLINNWFVGRERPFGFYLLCGGLGGAVGPKLVGWIVAHSASWRVYWDIIALAALALSLLALLIVRERPADILLEKTTVTPSNESAGETNWNARAALRTKQFWFLSLAMTVTLLATLSINSATMLHLSDRGLVAIGTTVLGLQALVSIFAKGLSGLAGPKADPRRLLMLGLALQALSMILFVFVHNVAVAELFAVLFGLGWGTVFFAVPMLLVNYFGRAANPVLLSTLQLITTLAMVGPIVGGVIADRTGGYSPLFALFAGLLIIMAGLIATMKTPVNRSASINAIS